MFVLDCAKEPLGQLYYLFMMADGAVTGPEKERFCQICKELHISDGDRDKIMRHCQCMRFERDVSHLETIHQEILRAVLTLEKNHMRVTNLSPKGLQVQIIWTLINLGYADGEYSKAEQKIVRSLAKRWKIKKSVVAELDGTAEALLALVTQKEWIKTTGKPYDMVHSVIEELDRNVQMMFDNVKVLISEEDMMDREVS